MHPITKKEMKPPINERVQGKNTINEYAIKPEEKCNEGDKGFNEFWGFRIKMVEMV